jgi:hypothetical protein
MKNIVQQYRDLMEGKMSQANFMTNVRREFPDWISPVNSFQDVVSILKSKRVLNEAYWMDKPADETKYQIKKDSAGNIVQATNDENIRFSKNDKATTRDTKEKIKIAGFKEQQGKVMAIYHDGTTVEAIDIDGLEPVHEFRPGVDLGKSTSEWMRNVKETKEDDEEFGEELAGKKAFYLVDESGEILDSTMAANEDEANQYFEDEYEGIGDTLTIIHTDAPEDLRGEMYEEGLLGAKMNPAESGLIVVGRTPIDNNAIQDFLDDSDYYAEWNVREGYYFFPEQEEDYDELERELSIEFNNRGIDARFEGIFPQNNLNEAKKKKASAGLTKKEKSAVVKKAKAGKDIGKKGKGFEKVEKVAEKKYGSKKVGEKVAAAAMWKGQAKKKAALKEAAEPTEGRWKEATGEKEYSIFDQIDRVNPYEFNKGLKIEMGMQYKPVPNTFTPEFNPESLVKATKKVLNNLEKDPAYYSNTISAEFEKKSGLLQHPKELKVGPDGRAPIPGYKDAKANTDISLSKKEKAKNKNAEGVKVMKPSGKSMGGLKTMKASDKLPKGVELMKEYVDLDPDVTAQADVQGSLKEKKKLTLKKLREYIAKSIKEDLYTNTKTGQTQSFDQNNTTDKKTMLDPKFNQTFKKAG